MSTLSSFLFALLRWTIVSLVVLLVVSRFRSRARESRRDRQEHIFSSLAGAVEAQARYEAGTGPINESLRQLNQRQIDVWFAELQELVKVIPADHKQSQQALQKTAPSRQFPRKLAYVLQARQVHRTLMSLTLAWFQGSSNQKEKRSNEHLLNTINGEQR